MTSACQLSRNDSVEAETDAGFIQREVAKISIHSARVGGDSILSTSVPIAKLIFQSTPPVWAETHQISLIEKVQLISIHSARVGGDMPTFFLADVGAISIHSARVGGDCPSSFPALFHANFNPLRPCGRRLTTSTKRGCIRLFQSTPPVWAETGYLILLLLLFVYFNPLRPCGRRLFRKNVIQ